MSSITRRLTSAWFWKRFFGVFFSSLVISILLFIGYLAAKELETLGYLAIDTSRSLSVSYEEPQPPSNALAPSDYAATESSGRHFYYILQAPGQESLRLDITRDAKYLALGVGVYFLLQWGILFAIRLPAERRRIARILHPLNELALKADELSRLEFSDDKYQYIEDAIAELEGGESERLSLGDTDLLGIEAAINNLLTRVRESNRQQARFVNDASHELRTPIAVIGGYADMLERWGKDDEKVLDESIHAIQTEVRRMQHLVEQLLFLARGDSGKTPLSKESISLDHLMRELYEESMMIDEAHIYRYQPAPEDIRIEADGALLKQALRILLDNAAKYTNEKDEIILSFGNAEGRPYLQVQDSGIGMAQADAQHMFERFYRADKARSIEGTGLGLSIAKWIVDKHEGHFEILSRQDIGTRIRIVL